MPARLRDLKPIRVASFAKDAYIALLYDWLVCQHYKANKSANIHAEAETASNIQRQEGEASVLLS